MRRISEIEKEFPASSHGDRVGWVRVAEREEFVSVDVVTASVVGEEGAQLSNEFWEQDDDDRRPSFPYQKGFGQIAVFSGFLSHERNWQEESNLHYTPEGMRYLSGHVAEAEKLIANGTGEFNRLDVEADKLWAESPSELLDTLRSELAKLGYEDVYEVMYYWINGAMGREYPANSALQKVDVESLLLPDPTMAEQTLVQRDSARDIEVALRNSVNNDTTIRDRITRRIDDTPMSELPAVFIKSRERAAELDQDVSLGADGLVVKRLAYVPVGQGRAKRSWPYMDASAPDASVAYGRELEGLEKGIIDSAVYQLDREIKELEARRTLASEAVQRFVLLSDLERSLL